MTAGENKSGGILARKCVEKHDARRSADFTANSCNVRIEGILSLWPLCIVVTSQPFDHLDACPT